MAQQEELGYTPVPVAEAVAQALHNTPKPGAGEAKDLLIGAAITGLLTGLEAAAAERIHVVGNETETRVADVLDAYAQVSDPKSRDDVTVTTRSYLEPGRTLFMGKVEGTIATTHSLDYLELLETGIDDQPGIAPEMLAIAERVQVRAKNDPALRGTIDEVEALGAGDILSDETNQMAASLTGRESAIRAQAEHIFHNVSHNDIVSSPAFAGVTRVLGTVEKGVVNTSPVLGEIKKRAGHIIHGLNSSIENTHQYLEETSDATLATILGNNASSHGNQLQIEYMLRGIAGTLGPDVIPAGLTSAQYVELSHALVTRGILMDPSHAFGDNATGLTQRTTAERIRMAAMFDWKQAAGLTLTATAAAKREAAAKAAQATVAGEAATPGAETPAEQTDK